MSRVELASIAVGTVWGKRLDNSVILDAGVSVDIYTHGTTTHVPVFVAETGGSTLSQPLTTDANGQLPGWCDGPAKVDVVVTSGGVSSAAFETDLIPAESIGLIPASVVTDASASPKGIDSTGVADTQVLAYNAASGKFKPVAQSSGVAALVPTAVKTANYTAAASDFVPCDVSGGGFTVTLPNAPADKTRVGIKIVGQAATVNALTIARGGTDVFNKAGGSTALPLTALFQGVILQYAATGGIWYVQSTDAPISATEVVNTVAASGAAQTIPDPSVVGNATASKITLTANCTLTFPGNPSSGAASMTIKLIQDATGGRTVTWPTLKWPGKAGPPTLTVAATGEDIFTFFNDGSGWEAFASGLNMG